MTAVAAESTEFVAFPGRVFHVEHPLNQGDIIRLDLNWAVWLGSDTISSSAWTADNGVTLGSTANTTTATNGQLTAGAIQGRRRVENQITTATGLKRSCAIEVEVVNLR